MCGGAQFIGVEQYWGGGAWVWVGCRVYRRGEVWRVGGFIGVVQCVWGRWRVGRNGAIACVWGDTEVCGGGWSAVGVERRV